MLFSNKACMRFVSFSDCSNTAFAALYWTSKSCLSNVAIILPLRKLIPSFSGKNAIWPLTLKAMVTSFSEFITPEYLTYSTLSLFPTVNVLTSTEELSFLPESVLQEADARIIIPALKYINNLFIVLNFSFCKFHQTQ